MTRGPKLLVDTNVWMDCCLPDRPAHGDARRFLDAALAHDAALLVSIATVRDFHYLIHAHVKRMIRMRKHAGGQEAGKAELTQAEAESARSLARAYRENLLEIADVVGADASDVWLARKYEKMHDDFEDDLIIAAMQRIDGGYLVTNDERLIRRSPVATVSTADALLILEMQG